MPADARHLPEADAWLAARPEPVAGAAHALRALLLDADPRVAEGVKWNAPSYHLGGVHFATFNARPGGRLLLVLHRDAKARPPAPGRLPVPDPTGLLEWRADDRACVTLPDADAVAVHREALTAIVRAWMAHL